MIAVIADDFTGAAEIGGIGLRHGLKIVIETSIENIEDVDLIIIATNTRSMPAEEAKRAIHEVAIQLTNLNPDCIFKKLDSVLRGNIVGELQEQMRVMNKKKALVIAGNPFFGRLIRNGIYYVNDKPLIHTGFAADPEFPLKSSKILDIVGENDGGIHSVKLNEVLPSQGLLFGDVNSTSDLKKWVLKIDNDSFPAGGSGFFNALLEKKYPSVRHVNDIEESLLGKHALFVFGSAYPKSQLLIRELTNRGLLFINIPSKIYYDADFAPEIMEQWTLAVIAGLSKGKKVVVGAMRNGNPEEDLSQRIQDHLAELVNNVMRQIELNDLLIEGGATTYTILNKLGVKRLFPFKELCLGVIQMKVDVYPDLCITTKPGSYNWPNSLFI
jgi:uncharacterized protein YgbK (DUF1537 family)